MENESVTPARPVIFGEVLFDHFPDGRSVLGGAPFNVAWHLKGFGQDPLFVSRVGEDQAGREVIDCMAQWGMDTRGMQRDSRYPTGAVDVQLENNQPSFDILADQAYDHIQSEPLLSLLKNQTLGMLYMGSLITRSPASRASLDSLLTKCHLPIFVDVNLRPPWWDLARVEGAMARSRWIKLNDDELSTILGKVVTTENQLAQAEILRTRFDIELLVLTHGAEGADLVFAGGHHNGQPGQVVDVVDTVGAGDAFSAVTMLGLMRHWTLTDTLARALSFAAGVCQQRGATADNKQLYSDYREQWGI